MMNLTQKFIEAETYIKDYCNGIDVRIGVVLGSGLGHFTKVLEKRIEIETSKIPHWPVSTVEGHQGQLVVGELQNVPVLILQGRVHYYEGYTIQQVVFPIL